MFFPDSSFSEPRVGKSPELKENSSFTAVATPILSEVAFEARGAELSADGSANRDSCELPGLVSALRGRDDVKEELFDAKIPEADEGLELEPQALTLGSHALSLPAVDGRVPPPDEGRPAK